MKLKGKSVVLSFFIYILITLLSCSYGGVKIKFIVMNPSEKERQVISIQYSLPAEIKPDDVIDAGGLEVDYDVEQGLYFVFGKVDLGPKETEIYKIEVKDVWKIPQEKLDLLRGHVIDKSEELKSSPVGKAAGDLISSISRRIESIMQDQGQDRPISKRIDAYRVNLRKVDNIENDLLILEGFTEGTKIEEKVVTIRLTVKNPYKKKYDFPIQYYLPSELSPDDVVDSAGFDVLYDANRSQVYINGSTELEGEGSQEFRIKVKDVWFIKETGLSSVEGEAKKIVEQLVDTDFEKLGNYLAEEIYMLIKQIRARQPRDIPLKQRVANYKENAEKFDAARKYLERLRSFILQFELARSGQDGKPNAEATRVSMSMGGGKAKGKGGGVGEGMGSGIGQARGKSVQHRGGGIEGIRGLKGIILVSRSLFRGWKPELATTWIIILSIIAFLFIMAGLFFIVWLAMSAKKKKKKLLE